jgi:hypothetical protein
VANDDGPSDSEPLSLAEELGRRAARLAKAAKPHVRRLAAEAGPRAQQAAGEALQYAKEHEEELRDAATKLARARLGTIGMAIDALGRAGAPPRACPSCDGANPTGAKFCNHCGAALAGPPQ